MIKKKKERTLKDILNVFVPKIWILLVVGAILASLMAGCSTFLKKNTYTTTMGIIVDRTGESSLNNIQTTQLAQETVKSYEIVILGGVFLNEISSTLSSDEIYSCFISESSDEYKKMTDAEKKNTLTAEKVVAEIKNVYGDNGITAKVLASMITIKTDDDTPTFVLKVTSKNPIITCAVSEVVLKKIQVNGDGDKSKLDELVESNLISKVYTEPERNHNVIKNTPNSKNTVRNSLIAFAIGFILAAAAVWVYSMFDVVIRDVAKIEENIDIPILGVIPRHEIGAEEGKRR